MAMTDVDRLRQNPAAVGDALRLAVLTELLQVAAQTLRYTLLNSTTWLHGRMLPQERDDIARVVARIETATADDVRNQCPLCEGHTCDTGCALEAVRELLDTTPQTRPMRA